MSNLDSKDKRCARVIEDGIKVCPFPEASAWNRAREDGKGAVKISNPSRCFEFLITVNCVWFVVTATS